jgi:hypothetical protein
MDVNSLTPHYFEWVVNAMADMAIRLARKPRKQTVASWEALFITGSTGAQMAQPAGPRKTAAKSAAPKPAAAKPAASKPAENPAPPPTPAPATERRKKK